MQVVQTKSAFLRPYAVQTLSSDAAAEANAFVLSPTLSLGQALKQAAARGTPAVVAVPQTAEQPKQTAPDYVQIAKALGGTAASVWGGTKVANAAWTLSALPVTTSADELAKTLMANNISPTKAPELAKDILNVLQDPISRAVLIGISAGVVTAVVVQRTSLSLAKKSALVAGAFAIAIGLFFAARHYGIAA